MGVVCRVPRCRFAFGRNALIDHCLVSFRKLCPVENETAKRLPGLNPIRLRATIR
jgi:hypothetical protein